MSKEWSDWQIEKRNARHLSDCYRHGPWLEQIKQRRPANVVVVAQAAKMARTIWAVTAKQQDFQRGFQSLRPQAV